MRFFTISALGIFLVSGASITSAQEVSRDLPAFDSVQQSESPAVLQPSESLHPASQAPYVVPVEIRDILEQNAALEAAAAIVSPPVSVPQMNAAASN